MGSDGTGMSLQGSCTGILYAHTNIHIALNEYGTVSNPPLFGRYHAVS